MKKRILTCLMSAALLLTGIVAPSFAAGKKHSGPAIVDLKILLAPPPAPDSEQTREELVEIKHFQETRTPAQIAYAQADVNKNIFRFENVMGEKFTAQNLPLTAALFKKALKVVSDTVDPAKFYFDRTRPFVLDKSIKPCVPLDMSPSYPSGHATASTVFAILLSYMVPEKKAEIFNRGWEFAENRVIGGVHYPSDIQAGRIAGTVIAAFLLKDKKFMKKLEAAKVELRTALGY